MSEEDILCELRWTQWFSELDVMTDVNGFVYYKVNDKRLDKAALEIERLRQELDKHK